MKDLSTIIPVQFSRISAGAILTTLAISCAASAATTGYSGQAFGSAVHLTTPVAGITSGTTAAAGLCTFSPGITNSNSVASVSVGGVVSTGAVNTSVMSAVSGTTQSTVSTATIAGVNLLGGLVTADAVTSVSTASSGSSGYSTSAAGTIFSKLKVLGLPILGTIAPNTELTLPGIGSVVLNDQKSTITSNSAQLNVTSILIEINQTNLLGLPVGSTIDIGSATASTLATVTLLNGDAFGTSVSAPPISLGDTALISLPCGGTTGGRVMTNNTLGATVPSVLSVGATTTTAQGILDASSAMAKTTATTAAINLLNGLVQATAVEAAANVRVTNSGATFSDQGSLFTGLTVTGFPDVGANPAANTQLEIAGLGTLYLHRVIQTSTSVEVRMVELVVTLENTLGLPVGADIRIADARVGTILP